MRVPQQRNTKTPGHGGGEEHTGTLATAQSTFWSTLLTSCIRLAKERYAVLQCFPVQPSRVVSYDCAVVIQDATTFNSASSATQWLSEWIMGPFAKSLRAELGVQARLWQAETHLQHKKYAHAVWQVLFVNIHDAAWWDAISDLTNIDAVALQSRSHLLQCTRLLTEARLHGSASAQVRRQSAKEVRVIRGICCWRFSSAAHGFGVAATIKDCGTQVVILSIKGEFLVVVAGRCGNLTLHDDATRCWPCATGGNPPSRRLGCHTQWKSTSERWKRLAWSRSGGNKHLIARPSLGMQCEGVRIHPMETTTLT